MPLFAVGTTFLFVGGFMCTVAIMIEPDMIK